MCVVLLILVSPTTRVRFAPSAAAFPHFLVEIDHEILKYCFYSYSLASADSRVSGPNVV